MNFVLKFVLGSLASVVTGAPAIGAPAAREVESAKKSSARKNNTIDNFIIFEKRMGMIKGEEMRRMCSDGGQL